MREASLIDDRLWQGKEPECTNNPEPLTGVHVLVLCWREGEAHWGRFSGRGVLLVPCPMRDDYLELQDEDRARALATSRILAHYLKTGRSRILVTCHEGRNRSGLVSALTLMRLYGWTGARAAEWVQRKRAGSLTNPHFLRSLQELTELPSLAPSLLESPTKVG